MGHSYNNGLHTSSKGITFDAVRITGLNTTPCTIAEDCKAGLVASVTKAVTGTVVLQLSKPYPPKLVICQPTVTNVNGTTASIQAEYKQAGYDATNGTLTIFLQNDDAVGVPVLIDGAAGQELHVLMAFNRYTN